MSGVAAAVKRLQPAVRIVGVEPAGASKMTRSLAAGHPVTLDTTSSIADGLLAVRPADITFAHVAALVDQIVTVTEEEIAESVVWLAREAHQVVEPSGAVAVAAARARHALKPTPGHVVALLSGGNVSRSVLSQLWRGGLMCGWSLLRTPHFELRLPLCPSRTFSQQIARAPRRRLLPSS